LLLENRIVPSVTVATDKLDYAPAETALITASGVEPGSTVVFQVVHDAALPGLPDGQGHQPWSVADGGPGDLDGTVNGSIQTSWYVDPDDSLGAIFILTASGLSQGQLQTATTTFTDANPALNLDQWANLSPASWQNGNLNQNNSSYVEDDSVPFRMILTNLVAQHTYTVGINFDTTVNDAHAYDYLTTYDWSENSPAPDPTQSVSGIPGGTSTIAIPVDPRVTAGPDGLLSTADDITQAPGSFTLFGGVLTAVSSYTLSGNGTYTTGVGYTGDTTTTVYITFTVGGSAGSTVTAVLAWGGHISSRFDWQPEPTAINISGSPYHMSNASSVTDVTTSTNYNSGAQDRSLKADAVISPGTITIIKLATPQGSTQFPFSMTGPSSYSTSFNLVDDGSSANTKVLTFTTFGTFTVTENVPLGWDLTNILITSSQSGNTSTSNLA
jgi:hypothetical protein